MSNLGVRGDGCQTWALEGDECPGLSVRDG